ncbi:MAG: helix-turn-helix domain-containing protein, partial [Bacteriovoracales bacterium]
DPEIYNLMGENILNIPPLSQRKEDIPIIVQQFIEKYSSIHNSKGTSIDEMALRSLVEYNWPSNVLELENLIERLVILHGGVRISHSDLPEKILKNVENSFAYPLPPNGLVLKNVIQDIENSLIGQALSRSRGNKNKAAQLLGLNRTTLVEKLKKKASKS